jgi:multiple sugar transport system permease protein
MYQEGIEQGKPGYAAAIGILLVIGTLVIALLQNRFAGGNER